MIEEQIAWAAVQARDKALDGRFFFGVLTTGVYCRPSCPARSPRRENVRFYETPEAAEADNLRACLRCRPLASVGRDPAAAKIATLCRYLEEHADEPVSLKDLAELVGLSRFHLQRSFKAITGVSPKAYPNGTA
jgi:AraC family transcriptional regulator of adaptative response/methylated-DNA-[protein]-cysteine methyltransferase